MKTRIMCSKRIYCSMSPNYNRRSSKRQRTYFVGDIVGLQVPDVDRTMRAEKHCIPLSRSMASYMRNSVRRLSSIFDHPISPHYVFSMLNHTLTKIGNTVPDVTVVTGWNVKTVRKGCFREFLSLLRLKYMMSHVEWKRLHVAICPTTHIYVVT